MPIDEAFLRRLIDTWECEWVDFKRQYHGDMAELVHDVICLANAEAANHRYMVFGVDDQSREIVGVGTDPNRKTQAQIINTLENAQFNHPPAVHLTEVRCGDGKIVDVLAIRNLPDKPYFLLRDKQEGQTRVRAGVAYTRVGDTNTPQDRGPDDLKLERMYRERLGLDRSPSERMRIYLRDRSGWKYGYDERNLLYFYYVQFPEFTLVRKNDLEEEFSEPWVLRFPDQKAHKEEFFLKYHGTTLESMILVWCDGGRYVTPLPRQTTFEGRPGQMFWTYYFVADDWEHLAKGMISAIYPDHSRITPDVDFSIFESEEQAKAELEATFQRGLDTYTFFTFEEGPRRYVKIRAGRREELFPHT